MAEACINIFVTNRLILLATCIPTALAVAAIATSNPPRSAWPWGQPIQLITVKGFGRTATLSGANALRYLAMAAERGSRFYCFNGPPSAPFKHGAYFATIRFADGRELYRELFASRFPRALCLGRHDPRTLHRALGSSVPVVALYRPMPRALAQFWRFLATPGDRGVRCFGPVVAPLHRPPAALPARTPQRPFRLPSMLTGISPLRRVVFAGNGRHIELHGKASLGFLNASQQFLPASASLIPNGPIYSAAVYGGGNQPCSRLWVVAQKYPRSLVFSLPGKGGYSAGAGQVDCPLYSPLPPNLYSAFEALLRHAGTGSRPVNVNADHADTHDRHLLAGTGMPILRIVFAEKKGAVVTLKCQGHIDQRQQSSIDYILHSQRFCDWGYLGKDVSPRYAAMFFIRGRKMPVLSWVAVERYPRELIFTPNYATLGDDFTKQPQIRCPLYGPLPAALYSAYEKLLHDSSVDTR